MSQPWEDSGSTWSATRFPGISPAILNDVSLVTNVAQTTNSEYSWTKKTDKETWVFLNVIKAAPAGSLAPFNY